MNQLYPLKQISEKVTIILIAFFNSHTSYMV